MAAIFYNVINDGNTTITSLNFFFVTPPEVQLHADLSTVKTGAPSDFSGTDYTITDLTFLADQTLTFSIDKYSIKF